MLTGQKKTRKKNRLVYRVAAQLKILMFRDRDPSDQIQLKCDHAHPISFRYILSFTSFHKYTHNIVL